MMPTKNHAKVLILMTILLLFVVCVETFLTPEWEPMILVEKVLLLILVWLSGYQWGRYRGLSPSTSPIQFFKNLRKRFK